jgi:hypothetical protein
MIPTASGKGSLPDDAGDLYHYTSEAGLRGIIESNSVWATAFEDLNDLTEIREIKGPLISELGVAFVPIVKEFRQRGFREDRIVSKQGGNIIAAKKIAVAWVDALYRVTFDKHDTTRLCECCVASFCSHETDQRYEKENGLLSQWRGYGGSGGFCLVFDTKKLKALLDNERRNFFYVHLDLRAAHYYMGGTPLVPLFPELLSHSREIVESAISGRTDFSTEQIFAPFVTSATTTKHRGFYEEREVRIVAMPASQYADKKIAGLQGYQKMPLKEIFTTEREGRERHHIALFGVGSPVLPVTRIIVGPSRDQARNIAVARKIVGDRIPVVGSVTPFVG